MANVLIFYSIIETHVGTINEHLSSFKKYSQHNITMLDPRGLLKTFSLEKFDLICFHYSVVISDRRHFEETLATKITQFSNPKILFIQDEMRWVDATNRAIRNLGISTIFSVANENTWSEIYREPYLNKVRFEQTLTGFVADELVSRKVKSYDQRKFDVSYRARKLPGWLGKFGQEKWLIGQKFIKDASEYKLKCNISWKETDRLYGENWLNLIENSKAVLGTESGSSFIDFTGNVALEIEAYEKQYPNVSFEEIQKKFLENRDGEIVISVISPRCFEAAALRTLMVMYEGEYSGILKPGKHYLPLEKDHSNMNEIVKVIRDPIKAQEIIDSAYNEIACSDRWTFKSFIKHFDKVVFQELSLNGHALKANLSKSEITSLETKNSNFMKAFKVSAARKEKLAKNAARISDLMLRILPVPLKPLFITFYSVLYRILKELYLKISLR